MELDLEVLGSAVQHSAAALLVTDSQGVITWANEAATRLTGYAHDELLGVKPGRLLQCEHTDPGAVSRIRRALSKRQSVTVDLLNRRKDGEEYWTRLMIHPWAGTGGAHQGFFCLQSDITHELKEPGAERSVQEQARSLLGQQLQAPLHSIVHLLHQLKEETEWESRLAMASRAIQASQHVLDLLDGVSRSDTVYERSRAVH